MKGARFLILVSVLLALASVPTAAAPLADPCPPGTAYHPACDVDQNNQINILDIQRTASRFNQGGVWVSDNNHNHLGQTWAGSNNPLKLTGSYGAPDYAPLVLSNSATVGYGLRVNSAGYDGVRVDSAGEFGVFVYSAGESGVFVNSAGYNGVHVGSAGDHGVYVYEAGEDGVYVNEAGGVGFYVGGARYHGMSVGSAGLDGMSVGSAGNPSSIHFSDARNGFEVASAEGFGLYVGRADIDGVRIRSTGDDGIQIGEEDTYPTYGLHVPTPGTPGNALWPNTANGAGEWALYTVDNIEAGNVFLSAQTLVAVVGGNQPLSPGDVVTAMGLADPIPGSLSRLAQVSLAAADQANVVGVVSSRMALQPAPGKEGEQVIHSTDGPAQPGDYVAITVLGAAQVKVAPGEAIQPGERLTVSATPGQARALQSKLIEGMMITEGASVIGAALEAPKDGLVWVLVNPQ